MTDFQTTIHNIPPASVAQILRGARQWATYQALAAAAGEWVSPRLLSSAVYGPQSPYAPSVAALYAVVKRLQRKGIPIQIGVAGYVHGYRLPLEWQREQDATAPRGADGEGRP
jgi:hypothetical protein